MLTVLVYTFNVRLPYITRLLHSTICNLWSPCTRNCVLPAASLSSLWRSDDGGGGGNITLIKLKGLDGVLYLLRMLQQIFLVITLTLAIL